MGATVFTWPELRLLVLSAALTYATSAAYATTVLTAPETLADLPWLSIIGAVGLSMAGGLVSTLAAMHQAGESGKVMRVPLRLARDLGLAFLIGCVAYAYTAVNSYSPYFLLGLAPVAGYGAAKLLDAMVGFLASRVQRDN